jgi:rubrerythrin
MLSTIPANLEKIKKEDLDNEILRVGIIAELDAINLYEQMAAMTGNEHIKKTLLDIAKEEKTHMGEFQTLLATGMFGWKRCRRHRLVTANCWCRWKLVASAAVM